MIFFVRYEAAGFNQSLGFLYGRDVDEDHALLFRCGLKEVARHLWDQSRPFAKLRSRLRPTEPEISAWPSRLAPRSESTNSIFRALLSSSKARVKNT